MTTSAGELGRIMAMRTLNITITRGMFDTYGEAFCCHRITAAIGIARNFGGQAIVISFEAGTSPGIRSMLKTIIRGFDMNNVKTRMKWNKQILNMAIYLNQPTKAPQNG